MEAAAAYKVGWGVGNEVLGPSVLICPFNCTTQTWCKLHEQSTSCVNCRVRAEISKYPNFFVGGANGTNLICINTTERVLKGLPAFPQFFWRRRHSKLSKLHLHRDIHRRYTSGVIALNPERRCHQATAPPTTHGCLSGRGGGGCLGLQEYFFFIKKTC